MSRICDGANRCNKSLPLDVKFASKQVNSAGLQLADWVARPVGLHVLRPAQENRSLDVPRRTFLCSSGRESPIHLTQVIFPQPFLPQDAGRSITLAPGVTVPMEALRGSLGLQAK